MNIHKFELNLKQTESKYLFVTSDNHFDSMKCDRTRLKKDFDKAKELDAWIIINGDWLDVMGAKHDPRNRPQDIRPEYRNTAIPYLDMVIKDAAKFLEPYAENILVIGYGNHETNIVKRAEIDPLRWMVELLNKHLEYQTTKHRIELGAYQGACIFSFQRGKANHTCVKKLFYHHGAGGGAQRSKGILSADIMVAQNSWADIIISGHDHNKWYLPYMVNHLNHYNKWIARKIDILRLGSYKKKSNTFGWDVEKNFNEPTLGGWLIEFIWSDIRYKDKTRARRIETKVSEI